LPDRGPRIKQPSVIGRRDAVSVGLASIAAAGSGLLILFISSRFLEKADNAEFIVFWSLLFGLFGVLTGIQTEVTRSVHMSKDAGSSSTPHKHPRVLTAAAAFGISLSLLVGGTSFLWGSSVLGKGWQQLVAFIIIGAILFSVGTGLNGVLSGSELWKPYSLMVAGESILRLILAALAAVLVSGVVGLAAGAAFGSLAWVFLAILSPSIRRAFSVRADVPFKQLLIQMGHSCMATGSSAALVVGFPVLVRLTSTDAVFHQAAPFLMAVTLTRAPLMIPLGTYQSVAVKHFLRRRHEGIRAVIPLGGIILGVGVIGGLLAWLIGPLLMVLLFGAGYHVDGPVLGGLTFAASLLALVTITGSLCLALHLHRPFSIGWLTGTVLAILVLLLPLPLEPRALGALTAGPLLGVVIHVWAVLQSGSKHVPVTSPVVASDLEGS
jgi:O-antigen/teichoic acid export membrane protein